MTRVVLALCLVTGLLKAADPPAKPAPDGKAELQRLGEFVGTWTIEGRSKADGRETLWTEKLDINWKFEDGNAWLTLTITDGKYLNSGELSYDPKTEKYRLNLTDHSKESTKYDGKLVKDKLIMTAEDTKTRDLTRLTLYTVAEGARLIWKTETQRGGRGLFTERFALAGKKQGETLAGGGKKPECILTGGLGTIPVSYAGKTYYVCCTGCRDEFNADPAKYAAEAEKKK